MNRDRDRKNPDENRNDDKNAAEYEEIILDDGEELEIGEDEEIEFVDADSEEYEVDAENDNIEFVGVPPPPPPTQPFGVPPPPQPFGMPPNFPPPPFAGGNMPPPFAGRPQYPFPPPPPTFFQRDEDDDLFESDGDDYIDEPEPRQTSAPKKQSPATPAASLKSMITPQAESLEKTGEGLSVKIKSGESADVFARILKYVGGTLALVLMFGGVYFAIATFMRNLAADNMSKSAYESGFVNGWRLEETRANRIVRIFYESLGDVSKSATFSDILLKGTVKMNGKEEPFYCIKRASGRSFIRIGNEGNERAYFVDNIAKGVFKLLDGRTTGRHLKLPERESLAMRSIVSFDELLFKRSFGEVEQGSYVEPMSYAGFENVNGADLELISAREDKFEIRYAFDQKTGLLGAASFNIDGKKYLTIFSAYEDNEGLKYPLKKEIFIDGKSFATVNTEFLIRNKGFLFP